MEAGLQSGLEEIRDYIDAKVPDMILSSSVDHGELTLSIAPKDTLSVIKLLRDDAQLKFTCIIDLCGVDYPERENRFDVVYHFLSVSQNMRIRVKLEVDEDTPVPSIVGLFEGAHWFEREAYDMYGILFEGHPDLRRLLTDYGFQGYPLRKDFPTTGYVEVRYDETQKRVVYEPVKLAQEMRSFDFQSPWEGTDYVLPGDEKAQDQDGAEAGSGEDKG